MKIAIVGAGGFVFPLTMIRDVLAFAELQDCTFALMDIDPVGLERTKGYALKLIESHGLPTRVEATTDRRQAFEGADFVIVTFQVGGVEAYRHDVEIPRKYGIDQCVGDTLGPGGVFRGLRSMAVLEGIARDMRELCPDATLIQYANPMSMNCWLTSDAGIKTIGLCHSVQGTSQMLAEKIMGFEPGSWSFKCAGINHQAWFTEFTHEGRDVLQELREKVNSYSGASNESDDLYGGGREQVRTAIMNLTGYFQTESSHHASEYLPYFRRSVAEVTRWVPERWDYYEICVGHDFEGQRKYVEELTTKPLAASHEYGAYIIHSKLTGIPRVVYGNVKNTGLITNLPEGCCVEVACLVDKQGVQPTFYGDLPPACAGVNQGSIAVQSCAVKASQTGDRELVHAAVALDKLTSALVDLPTCRKMVDEMFKAEAQWLPQFK
ncbi:MAG TPA: alpha-galactosidase [Fimbriimonas sp.]|nr:alpha-galactosidase [Fimbriimonas sp.]